MSHGMYGWGEYVLRDYRIKIRILPVVIKMELGLKKFRIKMTLNAK